MRTWTAFWLGLFFCLSVTVIANAFETVYGGCK